VSRQTEDDREAMGSRGALVVLEPGRAGSSPATRPRAAFVTQLLACRDGAPAYRSHRRAEPAVAVASYAATAAAARRRGAA
jgi:hypothetical protein